MKKNVVIKGLFAGCFQLVEGFGSEEREGVLVALLGVNPVRLEPAATKFNLTAAPLGHQWSSWLQSVAEE
jgi:hypothetical protein